MTSDQKNYTRQTAAKVANSLLASNASIVFLAPFFPLQETSTGVSQNASVLFAIISPMEQYCPSPYWQKITKRDKMHIFNNKTFPSRFILHATLQCNAKIYGEQQWTSCAKPPKTFET